MRSIAVILSTLIFSGCLSGHATVRPLDPESCQIQSADRLISYAIDSRFTAKEESLILEAMRQWQHGTGHRVAFSRVINQTPDINIIRIESRDEIQKERQLPPENRSAKTWIGLHWHGTIWLLAPSINTDKMFLAVALHEIGHAIINGDHLPDSLQGESCMTAYIDPACLTDGRLGKVDREYYCRYNICTCP